MKLIYSINMKEKYNVNQHIKIIIALKKEALSDQSFLDVKGEVKKDFVNVDSQSQNEN